MNPKATQLAEEATKREQAQDYAEALDLYTKAIETDPRCAEALVGRATLLTLFAEGARRENDPRSDAIFERAARDLETACVLRPRDAVSAGNLAMCYYRLNRPAEAQRAISRAIVLEPDNANLYGQRALCWSSLGDDAQAVNDYSRALKIRPNVTFLFNRASCFLRLGRLAEARGDFEKVAASNDPQLAEAARKRLETLESGSGGSGTAGKAPR